MLPDWLWQGFLTNWVFDFLVVGAGGAMILARVNQNRWSSPVLYGLATSALVGMLLYVASAQHSASAAKADQTNPSNVEEKIRAWTDNFNLTVQREDSPDVYFQYVVTTRSGVKVIIVRTKTKEKYIILEALLVSPEQDRKAFSELSKEKMERIRRAVGLEAARSRATFTNLTLPFNGAQIEKRIPITAALTEDVLINGIDDLEHTVLILMASVQASLVDSPQRN